MEFVELAKGIYRVVNTSGEPVIQDEQSALELIGTAAYLYGDVGLVLAKEDVCEAFFDLKSRVAGEVLQKFVNYNARLAIVGGYSRYTSKNLQDFIYESNKGNMVFFVSDTKAAVAKLTKQ